MVLCQGWLESGKSRRLRGSRQLERAAYCPITSEQSESIQPFPQRGPHQRQEPVKAVGPLAQVGGKAQQHIDPQGGPDLPAVAPKLAQPQRLLECLQGTWTVEVAYIQWGM